jgi:hypothetical protein
MGRVGTPARWYRLAGARAPWSDYGAILVSGMTAHQPRTAEGLLQMERTGPFVPPVTVAGPGDLLVTDAFRGQMEQSPLAGLGFRAVIKTRIVRLDWQRWDLAAGDPTEYPDGGEPEDYILGRPHDPALAAQLGPVWEVVLPGRGDHPEADLVRDPAEGPYIYAGRRARDWLGAHAGNWLSFADPADPGGSGGPGA